MNNLILRAYVKIQNLMLREEGQDMAEYALLLSLIAVVCIGTVSKLANGVTNVMNTVISNL
jgi:pilus assembly protein Flp/PilA